MAEKKNNNQISPQFSTGKNPLEEIIKNRKVEVTNCVTLNLRAYPDGPVVGVVRKGQRFNKSDRQTSIPGWITIKYNGGDACGMACYFKEV